MFEAQLTFQHTSVDLDHLESLVENDLACTWHLKDLKARVLQGPLRTLTTLPLCLCVFRKTFAKLSVSGQEGSSSNRSNILRLVKLSITSEFFKGIWLLTWINLAILSEKFASARCPWRNHDAVLDSLHQTSDFHRCSFLMMHCEDMQRYYAKMCKDVQKYAKLILSVQSFEECQKRTRDSRLCWPVRCL